ncbi:MAG TPA: ABC transporter substrate-binding protein [Puia sp.]|nr:ABC transporter substrate-binding protein [Puia sp.]
MKRLFAGIIFVAIYFGFLEVRGQSVLDSPSRHIAIFVPLYLDSVFDAGNKYRFDEIFPKFVSPGLEFYEGAQLALDTLQSQNAKLNVRIFDTHSAQRPLATIMQSGALDSMDLIIGFANAGESRLLSVAASHQHIPFVNINLPNNSNITENPDLVLLNSTLRTHCEEIYRFLQRNYATTRINYLYNKSSMGQELKNYFTEVEKNTRSVPLHLRFVQLNDPLGRDQLASLMDSTRQNVFVAGSLNESFSRNLCMELASFGESYSTTIIGMPTWDNIDFTAPEYKGLEIYYSTPFYYNQTDTLVRFIQQYFKSRFYSRPSDLVFRGYETIFHFGNLLLQYGRNLDANIREKKYSVFGDFDLEPVYSNSHTGTIDYIENKKLYFIKKVSGAITIVY